jgi:hypothetical protein
VTEERLADELRGFETLRDLQLYTSGRDTFETLELQRLDQTEGAAEVVIYVCWDATTVRVLDPTGADVTPSERNVHDLLEVTMVTVGDSRSLVLSSDEPWSSSTC